MNPSTSFSFPDPIIDESSSFFAENPTLSDVLGSDDPLSDPFIWNLCKDAFNDAPGHSGAGPSGFGGPSTSHGFDDCCDFPGNSVPGCDDQTPFSAFAGPVPQYSCVFCERLREIVHTNGLNLRRLEIHGRLGMITHAVLMKIDLGSSSESHEMQMFDFHKESMQIVKKFLVQYLEACKQEGYDVLQDPLATFYEALCVGLNDTENPDDFIHLSSEIPGDFPINQDASLRQLESGSNQVRPNKIPLAMQRERTRKLKLRDLKDYSHLPIEEAARKLNICPTVMKKICRKNGVLRWPYRKIRSIQSKMEKKSKSLGGVDLQEKARILEDIQKDQRELDKIYKEFSK